jgi:hypothetical protein
MTFGTHYLIAAGETHYASVFRRMFWADHESPTLTNHGVLWNVMSENTAGVIAGLYIPSVISHSLPERGSFLCPLSTQSGHNVQ